jgi:hypothetical protein
VVPCEDRRLLPVVAEHGDGSGAEGDGCSEAGCLPQEDRSENPQIVAVRDESDIAVGHRRKDPGEHARSAGSDLFDRLTGSLAPDHTVRERRPVVAELGADVLRCAPFVPAVVPLDEQRIDLGVESCELCRAAGALEGLAENEAEVVPGHQGSGRTGEILAVRGQRHVGEAGVPPCARPLGLAVP